MQAIAFKNFSKMFLRSILMTPDLLPLATFIKKKKSSRIYIRLHSFSKSLEMPLKLKNPLKNEFRKVIKENSLTFSLYKTLKLTLNKSFKRPSFLKCFNLRKHPYHNLKRKYNRKRKLNWFLFFCVFFLSALTGNSWLLLIPTEFNSGARWTWWVFPFKRFQVVRRIA